MWATDKHTDKQMDRPVTRSRSRCRERWLNKLNEIEVFSIPALSTVKENWL